MGRPSRGPASAAGPAAARGEAAMARGSRARGPASVRLRVEAKNRGGVQRVGLVRPTPDVRSVLRLGRLCGHGPGLWLRLQQNDDRWHAERRLREEVSRIPAHHGLLGDRPRGPWLPRGVLPRVSLLVLLQPWQLVDRRIPWRTRARPVACGGAHAMPTQDGRQMRIAQRDVRPARNSAGVSTRIPCLSEATKWRRLSVTTT